MEHSWERDLKGYVCLRCGEHLVPGINLDPFCRGQASAEPRPRASWVDLFNMVFVILVVVLLSLATLGVPAAENILCPRYGDP